MNQHSFKVIAGFVVVLAVANLGCATKKYARAQAAVVNDRLTQVQNDTNTQIAALATKHQEDISRVDERITTTDNKLAAVEGTANEASAAAARAAQQGDTNARMIQENSVQLSKVAAAQNYSVAETGNIMFGFNRSELTDEGKAALDVLIQKASASPRTIFEVVGFTDTIGTENYNLQLSQKRADSVGRYLVGKNVPAMSISLMGLGEEQTPAQLAAEVQGADPNATPKELRGLARRVRVRLYMPGTSETSQRASN